jgi:lysophospholipase L1-like esterase
MNAKIRFRLMALILPFLVMTFAPSTGDAGRFHKKADFTRVVFIGDSLTAGFQNGGLGSDGQLAGYPSLLAAQADFDITLPLISEPGIPPKLQLINVLPPVIEPAAGLGSRVNILEQATNLAVPGHTVNDALYRRPAEKDPITTVVLGFPGLLTGTIKSQIEWAEALQPTFAFVWIGNNDVLPYATSGGTRPFTPIDDFEDDYQELLHRLEATGADLIIANIPDVTSIAFFLTAEEVAAQAGQELSDIGPILGIQSGDLVTIEGLPLVEEILTGQVPPPLPDEVVLDAEEISISRQSVVETNRIIAREAYRRNIPLVNMNILFRLLQIFGVPVNGKQLNTKFLGGLFSLDGVHPSNTGYAITANHFIRTLNFRYRARIKRIGISRIAQEDPLVIPELLPDTRDIIRDLFQSHKREYFGPFNRLIKREAITMAGE